MAQATIHDTTVSVAEESKGPSQADFLGWLGLGLIGVMALFTLVVIGSGGVGGFQ